MRDMEATPIDHAPVTPPPVDNEDAPATAVDRSGETEHETYSHEQAQRHKDAEEGRPAEWVATDPVD